MIVVGVTGATGHLGACLVRQLLVGGATVRVLLRNPGAPALRGCDVEPYRGDVRDPDTVRRFMAGVHEVFHLAARISIAGPEAGLVHGVNVQGAANVAEAALRAGVRRMVHVSSVHAFARGSGDRRVDEHHPRAVAGLAPAYDVSKAGGEARVRRAIAKGLDAVIVHPSGILGPFDYGPSRMGRVLLDLVHGRMPALVDGGFDWVDVRDVAASTLTAMERGRTGHSYILSGHYQTMADLARLAAGVTGVRPPRFTSPMWLARAGTPLLQQWARLRGREPMFTREALEILRTKHTYVRVRAGEDLGHQPRPIAESIRDAYASFAALGHVRDGPRRERLARPVSLV